MENNTYAGELQIAEDGHIKLDYTLETPEERSKLVELIISETPPEKLTKKYLKMLDMFFYN